MMLDVFDLCTTELQQKLLPRRELFRLQDEDVKMISKAKKLATEPQQTKASIDVQTEQTTNYAPYSFENDLGSNNSGYYELTSVLTHKGKKMKI